jgi:hypothetical protein
MPERLLLTLIGSVLVGLGLEIPISRGALDPPAPVRHLTHCGSFNGGRAHPFRGHAALACSGMQWPRWPRWPRSRSPISSTPLAQLQVKSMGAVR